VIPSSYSWKFRISTLDKSRQQKQIDEINGICGICVSVERATRLPDAAPRESLVSKPGVGRAALKLQRNTNRSSIVQATQEN
jgi:hypothetical protein